MIMMMWIALLWPSLIDWLNAWKHERKLEMYDLLYLPCGVIFRVCIYCWTPWWDMRWIIIPKSLLMSVITPRSFSTSIYEADGKWFRLVISYKVNGKCFRLVISCRWEIFLAWDWFFDLMPLMRLRDFLF